MIWFRNELEKKLFILWLCLIISGIIGVLFVQTPNFDFYTYHYHSGWAFLNNRLSIDFLPCQARSYFNPIFDTINFYLIDKLNLHPYWFLFISNFKYGVYLFLTYLISDFVFKDKYKNVGILSSLFLAIISPIVIFTMRMDFTDIQSANIILISLYLQIKYIFEENLRKKYLMLFLSALAMGLGIGLKNSSIVFAVPMVISTLIYLKKDSKYFIILMLMFMGGVLGVLITDGWWKYLIWAHFQNPVFPYSNHIFKSPMAEINNYTNTEYSHLLSKNFFDYIFAPLKNTIKNEFIGHETIYFEPKMILTFISCIIFFATRKIKSFNKILNKIIDNNILIIFLIYIILGYYINSAIFGSLRYVIALFVISSVVITALSMIYQKVFNGKIIYPALVGVLIWSGAMFYFETNTWVVDRKIHIVVNTFYIPKIKHNATVLCGNQTACFVAPFLSNDVKYVAFTIPNDIREKYSLMVEELGYENYYYHSQYLENKVKEIFEKEKSLYIIFNPYSFQEDIKAYKESLKYYSNGKIKNFDHCAIIRFGVLSSEDTFYICRLK